MKVEKATVKYLSQHNNKIFTVRKDTPRYYQTPSLAHIGHTGKRHIKSTAVMTTPRSTYCIVLDPYPTTRKWYTKNASLRLLYLPLHNIKPLRIITLMLWRHSSYPVRPLPTTTLSTARRLVRGLDLHTHPPFTASTPSNAYSSIDTAEHEASSDEGDDELGILCFGFWGLPI